MRPANELPKSHHEYVPPQPAADPLKATGYVEKEYEHREYPKVLNLKDADGKPFDVTVRDEKHEVEIRAQHAAKLAAVKPEEVKS